MSYVDSVSRLPVDNSTALNPQKAPNFAAELQAAQVKVSQSQTADITIVTAQGDTVTLSSSKSAELSFATYNAQGQVGGSTVSLSGMSAELQRTSAFSLSVDGDLNKEELKDIRRAIRTIQKAANDVLKGHEKQAAARTERLANLDQIANINADLEFNREVSITRITAQSNPTAIPESTEEVAPTPAPTPDSQEAAPSETAPVQTWNPAEAPAASSSSVATATSSTHVSVVIQTQTGTTPSNAQDSSTSGLWWFPSQDLWQILHPKDDSLTPAPIEEESTTSVAV